MAQSKDVTPDHPITKQTIPSDRESAIGCGPVRKGYGDGMKTSSAVLGSSSDNYGRPKK